MEVTVDRIEEEETEKRSKGYHEDFTVFVNGKRILTVYAHDASVADKWMSEVRKTYRNKKGPVVVGVRVEDDHVINRYSVGDEMMTICVGSHCLVFNLPDCLYRWDQPSRVLRDFLSDPKMLFVGMDMNDICKSLEETQGLKMARSGDVRPLAVQVMKDKSGDDVSARRAKSLTMDDAATQLLDQSMYVEDRPEYLDRDERWEFKRDSDGRSKQYYAMNSWYVKFQTVDAYLCHEIGVKYLEELKKLSSKD